MAMSETTSFVYDTHAAVRRLTSVGMPETHAEAVVGEQSHVMQHNLATKADIETSRLETKAEIAAVRGDVEKFRLETNARIDVLREETKAEIAAVRGDVEKRHLETKAEIEKLRLETNASIDALRQETKAGIEVLRQETKANTETAKNDIVKWIVTMGLAAVAALAGLAVAVIRLI